ncbi:hypothetical protein WT61_17105 [Burkholderia stagnalis]|nr:hypothetical protein WT61_17105 [Burkholderia stagnalis]KWH41297.1 hypothetical protein WT62_21405 [Burkholderia stagnalis]
MKRALVPAWQPLHGDAGKRYLQTRGESSGTHMRMRHADCACFGCTTARRRPKDMRAAARKTLIRR